MKKNILVLLLLCLMVTSVTMEPQEVGAATKTNWKKVYKDVLEKAQMKYPEEDFLKCKYELVDMNNDKIPELVILSDRIRRVYLYTCKGNKVDDFLLVLGEDVSLDPQNNMILIQDMHHNTRYDSLFEIKNGKFVSTWRGSYDDFLMQQNELCMINDKIVSTTTYMKKVKEFEKQCNLSINNVKKYSWRELRRKLKSTKETIYTGEDCITMIVKGDKLIVRGTMREVDDEYYTIKGYKEINKTFKIAKNFKFYYCFDQHQYGEVDRKAFEQVLKESHNKFCAPGIDLRVKGNTVYSVYGGV